MDGPLKRMTKYRFIHSTATFKAMISQFFLTLLTFAKRLWKRIVFSHQTRENTCNHKLWSQHISYNCTALLQIGLLNSYLNHIPTNQYYSKKSYWAIAVLSIPNGCFDAYEVKVNKGIFKYQEKVKLVSRFQIYFLFFNGLFKFTSFP